MTNKTFFIMSIILFMFIISVQGSTYSNNYLQAGGINGSFILDKGIFRAGISSSLTGLAGINSPKLMPLMADLDNDTVNELVVLDGATFKLFTGKTLVGVNSYTSPIISSSLAYFILYDIDGDSLPEIIAADKAQIEIIKYNGTHMYRHNNFSIETTPTIINGQTILGCRGVNDCVAITNQRATSTSKLLGTKIFSTHISNVSTLIDDGIKQFCHPSIPFISNSDLNGDSSNEYVFSITQTTGVFDILLKILSVDTNSSNQPYLLDYKSIPYDAGSMDTAVGCSDVVYRSTINELFSEPIVAELNNVGGSKEVVIAMSTGTGTFRMKSYDNEFNLISNYPTSQVADGQIVSNIVLANVFEDDNENYKDFCVLGMDSDTAEPYTDTLDLLCGTFNPLFSLWGFTINSDEFILEMTRSMKNISSDSPRYNNMIHASPQGFSDGRVDLVSSFGLMDADFSGRTLFTAISQSDLELQYINPKQDSAVVMLDLEDTGNSDLIVLDKDNLYYYNDGFINSGATITSITTNPCLGFEPIKINTSVQVFVTVGDNDGDTVQANASFYDGDASSADYRDWLPYQNSGLSFSFLFVANETKENAKLVVNARDSGMPLEVDSVTNYFNVRENGLEFGDSTCEIYASLIIDDSTGGVSGTTTTTLEGAANVDENVIKSFLETDILIGWGLGTDLLWLILMIAIAYFAWIQTSSAGHAASFGVIGLMELLMLILGVKLGFISVGILITIILLCGIIIAIWVGKILTGHKAI